MKRKVFFRADCNNKIGRGHVSRCVAAADMISNDFDVIFIVLSCNESYFLNLNINHKSLVITANEEVLENISNEDIVWLDGYEFSEGFKSDIKEKAYKLIETNDIPYKAKNVDLIVNHTPTISQEDFLGVGNEIQLLLGLEYVLLRKSFLKIAQKHHSGLGTGEGVFICFGGADTFDLGTKFVKSLLNIGFTDPIYWVAKSVEEAEEYSFSENVHILSNLDEKGVIQYMSISKVVLIPSSVLSFEAMAIRKPIFTGYFVDNQKMIYKGLIEQELAEGCGYMETIEDVNLATELFMKYYFDQTKHSNQLINQKKAIDGFSGDRIKNVLLE